MPKFIYLLLLLIPAGASSQSQGKLTRLTVEKIMSDPRWIGTSPEDVFWNAEGSKLFFSWNPEKNEADSLYYITPANRTPVKATLAEKQTLIRAYSVNYNDDRTAYVYEQDGDIYYHVVKPSQTRRITQTEETEYNPVFSFGGKEVVYNRNQDLFAWNINSGATRQLTHFTSGNEDNREEKLSAEDKWLKSQQVQYMQVLKERKDRWEATRKYDSLLTGSGLKQINTNGKNVRNVSINAAGNFIGYFIYNAPQGRKSTIVPNYITESGYTTDIRGREKVGQPQGFSRFFIYDVQGDSSVEIKTDSLEGIRDIPDFYRDYPATYEKMAKERTPRQVSFFRAFWSPQGSRVAIDIRSLDHKDRWLALWDTRTRRLQLLDRQHDSAWIDGPGMWSAGWTDEDHFWYQSEATGYSHLYTVNVVSGEKKALTSGNYEVLSAKLSIDKKYFYLSTNEGDPGQHQFYRLRIADRKQEKLTSMMGANEVTLSPDEKTLAILYSYTNKPWELYIQENKAGAKAIEVTSLAQSDEFRSYPWRDARVITFPARDGALVHARIYTPDQPDPHKPAVIFVHGAGYLQNAHKWWSSYFREYMFNNMLADNGYYVMDIDYRASAGYGRDWRTGIYRYMGGKDLSDNIDGIRYLVKTYGVDPARIGMYGGSYGGFMTLMAMLTTNEVAAGAALRSVTDWANYNHGYTSNILNEPYNDSIAYQRSSPIYFAKNLKGHLLMCHGMVDENVHFQDIVKLTQRFIEEGKNNWELAVYPMEDHGFIEPSSWTDEYKRIFNLFETVLKK